VKECGVFEQCATGAQIGPSIRSGKVRDAHFYWLKEIMPCVQGFFEKKNKRKNMYGVSTVLVEVSS